MADQGHRELPLVTVIVPCFNHSAFVEECIESVIRNGYSNLQLIVIDDASDDGSVEILLRLQERFGFELILKERNAGISDSLNLALTSYVNGKYYKAIASDDVLIDGCIMKAVEHFELNPDLDVLIGHAYGLNARSERIRCYPAKAIGQINYKNFMRGRISYNASAAIFRTSIHRQIGLYEPKAISEDIYFFRTIFKNLTVDLVDIYISGYRTHQSNKSKDIWLMYQEGLKALKVLEGDEYFKIKKRREYLCYFAALSSCYRLEALKYFVPSLRFFYSRLFLIGLVNLSGLSIFLKKAR